jgi:predicted ATP-grasp superfamily ATP-dependent carboligase
VKPSQGHLYFERFRRKMVKAETPAELLDAYREAADAGLEVMLQEFIPGDSSQGVNYNSYTSRGTTLVEFTAAKVRNAPRDTGSPCVAMSARVDGVLEPGRAILRAMGFSGYACTEFKRDPRDGTYKLMEVNGRHNLSSLLSVRCGINFPWIHYQHLMRGQLPAPSDYETGVYWIDVLRDVNSSPGYVMSERYSLTDYLKPYLRPHVFAVPDMADPKPFGNQCARIVRGVFRRPAAS